MELVNEFLKLLGNTPHQIASTLHQNNIKGIRRAPGRCPLAEAIGKSQIMGGPVIVDQICIQLWGVGLEERVRNCFYLTPEHDAVRDFIRDFDKGCYPFLEQHDEFDL